MNASDTGQRSRWTQELDGALEKLAAAHLELESLHREMEEYRDNFDPEADDAAGNDFALLEEACDAVGALKERLDMSEINGDLDLDEDRVKETLDRLARERGAGQ